MKSLIDKRWWLRLAARSQHAATAFFFSRFLINSHNKIKPTRTPTGSYAFAPGELKMPRGAFVWWLVSYHEIITKMIRYRSWGGPNDTELSSFESGVQTNAPHAAPRHRWQMRPCSAQWKLIYQRALCARRPILHCQLGNVGNNFY